MVTLVSTANLCLSVRRSTKTMLAVGLTQNSLNAIADAELWLYCCPFFGELRDRQICSITVYHLPYRACLHHGASTLFVHRFWMKKSDGQDEPDNWKGNDPSGENCGLVSKFGYWRDNSCKNLRTFVCETIATDWIGLD